LYNRKCSVQDVCSNKNCGYRNIGEEEPLLKEKSERTLKILGTTDIQKIKPNTFKLPKHMNGDIKE